MNWLTSVDIIPILFGCAFFSVIHFKLTSNSALYMLITNITNRLPKIKNSPDGQSFCFLNARNKNASHHLPQDYRKILNSIAHVRSFYHLIVVVALIVSKIEI
uniref:Uncharacterized protein n=1 Tax=Glossina pallidipes TaxID=7398 RepID=A0A1A9Z301_GLOPL